MMVSITKGSRERRRSTKRRDEEKSTTQKENRNKRYLHSFCKDAQGHNCCLLMTGAGLLSSCLLILCLYCLQVPFFCGASFCSGSSLCLLYFPKIHPVSSNDLNTTRSGWRSASNHLSRLSPWRRHWPGKSSGAGGSGVGVSLLGSLSLGIAKICVTGVSKDSRLPNLRVWVTVCVGLCGKRWSPSESIVKLKCKGTKSSSKCVKNLVAGERRSMTSSCSGPGGTFPTAAGFCTTSSQCSLTGSAVPCVSSTLVMYGWLRCSPVILGMALMNVWRVL